MPDVSEMLLELRDVTKTFQGAGEQVVACDHVSLAVEAGRSLALVGESGSGKSTLARVAVGLVAPDPGGSVRLFGHEVTGARPAELRKLYARVQMVFQNPAESFNPRRRLGESIVDAARGAGVSRRDARARLPRLLSEVGLDASYAARYPSEVSGGECQRAGIARALAFDPDLVICDEATSALDVLVQSQITDLLRDLCDARGLTLLFICHDLAVARMVCDDVAVMLRGRVVERGPSNQVIGHARHPYTQLMEASVFPSDPRTGWTIPRVSERETSDEPAAGCPFSSRCPHAKVHCLEQRPPLAPVALGHEVACWEEQD